jgi:hypothetical protein
MSYDNAFDGSAIVRLIARVFAWRYDQQLLDGVTVEPGSPLAMHIARLTSDHERRALARTLSHVLREADAEQAFYSQRVPPNQGTVMSAVDQLDEVRLRLEGPRPVRAHGVARLRTLLGDGIGPFYEQGRGDLATALHEVLADL